MPLTPFQNSVLATLWSNRDADSHLAGASAIHTAPTSIRYSGDFDFFHNSEIAVANAFAKDRKALEDAGYSIELSLSQPGFIRAKVARGQESILIDWAHDSAWRFMPTVTLEGIGHVLHPVDLAVNKVLALGGRDEPRDWVDTLYIDAIFLSLGAMVWAAAGKDPGLNPAMLLQLLRRKGKIQQRDLDRLVLAGPVCLKDLHAQWDKSLNEAHSFVQSRPAAEAGCLYLNPDNGRIFTPGLGEDYQVLGPGHGGIVPRIGEIEQSALVNAFKDREGLERFFGRKVMPN